LRWPVALFLGFAAVSCSRVPSSSGAASIDLRLAADERRAANLRAQTIQLQRQLEAQIACIRWARCQAIWASLRATQMQLLAECNQRSAQWHACDAGRAKKTAGGAGVGCLFGLAVAGATGGAAAPWLAVGCAGGALGGVSSASGPCTRLPEPRRCGELSDAFKREALRRRGLGSEPEQCGSKPASCVQLGLR